MKKYLLEIIVIAVILTSCGQTKSSVPNIGNVHGAIDESIELQIDQVVEESGAPSMAVGIVVKEEIIWAKGYGLQPDLSTVYSVGSIEKSFLATAVLQLIEQELIHLLSLFDIQIIRIRPLQSACYYRINQDCRMICQELDIWTTMDQCSVGYSQTEAAKFRICIVLIFLWIKTNILKKCSQ
jgi:hypothetical protein